MSNLSSPFVDMVGGAQGTAVKERNHSMSTVTSTSPDVTVGRARSRLAKTLPRATVSVGVLAAAVTNPATPPAAPGTSVLAWTAPPQSSPPPIEAVLGQTFPVAELPYPQSTRRKPLDHPPPIPLLCRIA